MSDIRAYALLAAEALDAHQGTQDIVFSASFLEAHDISPDEREDLAEHISTAIRVVIEMSKREPTLLIWYILKSLAPGHPVPRP